MGCDSEAPSTFSLTLSAGQDADALAQPPAPTRFALVAQQGASPSTLQQGAWPPAAVEVTPPSGNASLRAELRDDAGSLVAAGFSPELPLDQLVGGSIPVHCGRVGAFSRPSLGLAAGRDNPALSLVAGRYLFVSSSPPGDTPSELYDLLALGPLKGSRPLPRSPRSVAASKSGAVLLLDDTGASLLDVTSGASTELAASLADAAGGATVHDPAGAAYIVGATRESKGSAAVVRVDAQGAVAQIVLSGPRRAAAAAWVDGVGLVVAGGDAEGPVEIVAPGASAAIATGVRLPALVAPTLAPLGDGSLLLTGGGASHRFSISCPAGCPAPRALASGPGIRAGQGYFVGASKALLVGSEPQGNKTVAFLVDGAEPVTFTPVELRRPREGGTSLQLPDRRVVVLGGAGGALDVEIFTPF